MSDATMTDPTTRNGVDTATLFATRDASKVIPGSPSFSSAPPTAGFLAHTPSRRFWASLVPGRK